MATQYLCKSCNLVFVGVDPIWFGASAQPSFPECPNGAVARYLSGGGLPEGERDILAMMTNDEKVHPVCLATVEKKPEAAPQDADAAKKPALSGAWGKGPLKIKEETAEEKKARLIAEAKDAQKRQAEKLEAEKAQRVSKLLKKVETMIAKGDGGKSAKFPKDLEYGFKPGGSQLCEHSAIIMAAGAKWCESKNRTFRKPKYKPDWKQFQANFEQDIVDGKREQEGKHNVHVVATDKTT